MFKSAIAQCENVEHYFSVLVDKIVDKCYYTGVYVKSEIRKMSLLSLDETYEYVTTQSYIHYNYVKETEIKVSYINDPEKEIRLEERIGGRFGNHGILIRVA